MGRGYRQAVTMETPDRMSAATFTSSTSKNRNGTTNRPAQLPPRIRAAKCLILWQRLRATRPAQKQKISGKLHTHRVPLVMQETLRRDPRVRLRTCFELESTR